MLFQLLGEKIHQWPKPRHLTLHTTGYAHCCVPGPLRVWKLTCLLWLRLSQNAIVVHFAVAELALLNHIQSPRIQGLSFLRVSSFTNPLRCSLVLSLSLHVSRLGKGHIFPPVAFLSTL